MRQREWLSSNQLPRIVAALGKTGGAPPAPPWYLSGGIAAANCIAAYQPKGAGSYADSKVNLANSGTYDCADGASFPTWNGADGWIFDGVAQYLDTALVPVNDQTWSAFCQFTDAGAGDSLYLFGAYVNANIGFGIAAMGSGAATVIYRNSSVLDIAPQLAAGNLGVAGLFGYRNGVSDGAIAAGPGVQTQSIFIGAINASGAVNFLSCKIQAFSVYDTTITAPQITALVTAMAAL